MPERFFDKIRLFKGAEIQPGRPPSEAGEEDKAQPPGRRIFAAPWFLLIAVALVAALFLTRFPSRNLSGLALGDVAPTDIVAPFDLVIEDAEETARKRAEAADAILPVYTFDLNVFANTEESVRRLFAEGRAWVVLYPGGARPDELRARLVDKVGVDLETPDVASLARLKFPADLEETLIGLLTKISAQGIVVAKTLFIHGEVERGLTLIDGRGGERNVRAGDLLDIRESEALFAADLAKIELAERGRALVSGLGQIFLTSNVTYNKIETDRRKAAAREAVPPVTLTVKKDRIIVRKGDEVTADSLKVLDRYNERIRNRANVLPHIAGIFLLYALLLFALWTFLRDSRKLREAVRQFRMTCVSLVASLVLYEAFIVLTGAVSGAFSAPAFARVETYYLAFPFQAAVLIFAFLVDAPMTLLYIVLNSLTVGILLGADFFLTAFCFLGGLAAGYGVKLYKRRYRAATLRAGFTLLPAANVFTVIIFSLILLLFITSMLFMIRNNGGTLMTMLAGGIQYYFRVLLPQLVILFAIMLVFILCTITFALLGQASDIGLMMFFTIAILIPTLILTFFFDMVAVFEDRRVFESIQRSVLLVSNHMMEVLSFFIVAALLCAGVVFSLMIVWEVMLFEKLEPIMEFTDAQREAFTPDQLLAMIGQDGIWVTALILFIGVLLLIPLLYSYKACVYKKMASSAVMIEQQTYGEYDSKGRWYKY